MVRLVKIISIFLIAVSCLNAQEKEIDNLIEGELKMTFPSVYFKHNSTEYASMPYTVDSCFKYISLHFADNINNLVIWRDSLETEELTGKRIKKLKTGLRKYIKTAEIEIYSMQDKQKISRHTINLTSDSAKINYLLSLNAAFDISKTHLVGDVSTRQSHIIHPKIWCWGCWKNGFHLNKRGREARKVYRRSKKNQKIAENTKHKKAKRHLVWTGWKTGFHWSTAG